jgi:hypothetical protein
MNIIPENSFLIKEGLYCHEYQMTFGNLSYTVWELFAADGYCFYDLQQPENYDEDGNLLPIEKLVHMKYMKTKADQNYLDNIICVPCEHDYDIV